MQFRKLKPKERNLCLNCGLFLLPGETEVHEKQGHAIRPHISKKDLKRPTVLFPPLEDNKTFAVRQNPCKCLQKFCNLGNEYIQYFVEYMIIRISYIL